jgi:paraquat-inducible protein A
MALIAAAFVLFFPANIYPMNTSVQMGTTVTHTIFNGVELLFGAGLWPLGILIFCTSIAIPAAKIFGLGWCVLSARRGSPKHLTAKTRVYRFVDEIGRWSNVDPFTIVFFVPLMNFGTLASADAAPGSTAFILVVVLTMLASRTFDPRLMWDAARGRPQ